MALLREHPKFCQVNDVIRGDPKVKEEPRQKLSLVAICSSQWRAANKNASLHCKNHCGYANGKKNTYVLCITTDNTMLWLFSLLHPNWYVVPGFIYRTLEEVSFSPGSLSAMKPWCQVLVLNGQHYCTTCVFSTVLAV